MFDDTTDRDKQQLREVLGLGKPASELTLVPTLKRESPHAPTPDELADIFRPTTRRVSSGRDQRIAALTRTCQRAMIRAITAQRAARWLTRYAKGMPEYEVSAREARVTALALVRHRDAMQQELTALVSAKETTT